jgi:predicted AlkP superfamily phosphohydrolase/phosphomutase
MKHSLNRRDFLAMGLAAGSIASLGQGCGMVHRNSGKKETRRKMIILGFDGMDPGIVESMMGEGKLPSFSKLRKEGAFRTLRTSLPPQSPVAWSNFITGMDPGGHGIYDFIHRTPADYIPFLSTSRVQESKLSVRLGNYVFPISGGKAELLRGGRAFWQILEDYDVPATIVQIPSNFPPAPTSQRTLSGMGTPDIQGTYGIFSFYTTQKLELEPDIGGGKITSVRLDNNCFKSVLEGPANSFRKSGVLTQIPFQVFVDPVSPVAKIQIQDHEFILKQGEWSEWKRVSFPLIPTQSVAGICQFYLKQVRPDFQLYISPVNIDPAAPALPISTPPEYSGELAKHLGPFFTKGLPADTKALDHGALDYEEFLAQDESVLKESLELFEYELKRFESGVWFHYFSSSDQRQHMFLRLADKTDPHYDSALGEKFGSAVEHVYQQMDEVLARAMAKVDRDTVLMVMSDHGFAPFRRSFNLNTWLLQNGYHQVSDPSLQESAEYFSNTDWSGTRAYALGINGLYLNMNGREGMGIVNPGGESEALVREIAAKLETIVDPLTGLKPVSRAYPARQMYHGPFADQAPDIIVGYSRGYRASWATPLGRMPKEILEDNKNKWGADHCMDPELIPGILFVNREIRAEKPALFDLTATILDAFNVEKPPGMIGRSIL